MRASGFAPAHVRKCCAKMIYLFWINESLQSLDRPIAVVKVKTVAAARHASGYFDVRGGLLENYVVAAARHAWACGNLCGDRLGLSP